MKLHLKHLLRRLYDLLPWQFTGIVFRMVTLSVGKVRKFRMSKVGENSYIDPTVQIIGWENISIGCNTTISEESWLNVNYRDKLNDQIIIGNNCHIGRRNFFSSGPLIRIKDYGFTGLDCHFLGCGHNIESPLTPYIASGLSIGGCIEIGVNCWLATSVTVMQNVKIGHGTVVGARSVVTRDLPPFSIAVGNPCRVVKRFDFINKKWIKVEMWNESLEKAMPDEDEYLAQLVKQYQKLQPSLIASSRRFGWL